MGRRSVEALFYTLCLLIALGAFASRSFAQNDNNLKIAKFKGSYWLRQGPSDCSYELKIYEKETNQLYGIYLGLPETGDLGPTRIIYFSSDLYEINTKHYSQKTSTTLNSKKSLEIKALVEDSKTNDIPRVIEKKINLKLDAEILVANIEMKNFASNVVSKISCQYLKH